MNTLPSGKSRVFASVATALLMLAAAGCKDSDDSLHPGPAFTTDNRYASIELPSGSTVSTRSDAQIKAHLKFPDDKNNLNETFTLTVGPLPAGLSGEQALDRLLNIEQNRPEHRELRVVETARSLHQGRYPCKTLEFVWTSEKGESVRTLIYAFVAHDRVYTCIGVIRDADAPRHRLWLWSIAGSVTPLP